MEEFGAADTKITNHGQMSLSRWDVTNHHLILLRSKLARRNTLLIRFYITAQKFASETSWACNSKGIGRSHSRHRLKKHQESQDAIPEINPLSVDEWIWPWVCYFFSNSSGWLIILDFLRVKPFSDTHVYIYNVI